jgi:hypothetical protein
LYITFSSSLEGEFMASEKLDSTSLKASIEAKISAWQAVLDALAVAQATDVADFGVAATSAVPGDLGRPIDLPKGAFHGKSVPVCVELYLSAGKVKRTNKEIAAALKKGGVESNAKDFDTVVNGALFGLKKAGKALRFDDGWGLAEWYPAHIRAVTPVVGNGSKKTAKKGKRKPARKSTTAKPAVGPLAEPTVKSTAKPPSPPAAKPSARIDELLHSKPGMEYGLDTIAQTLGLGTKFVRLTLGKLAKAGRVEKTPENMYRSA